MRELRKNFQALAATATKTLAVGVPLALVAVAALTVNPKSAQAVKQGETLAALLIAESGGGDLDNNPRDFDIIIQTVIALEDLGGDPDLGGATLLDVLSDPTAEVTVFVPRDRAMRRLAKVVGWDGNGGDGGALTAIVGALPLETIRNVVKYHVVPQKLALLDVLETKNFDTALPGASFSRKFFSFKDADPDLANPRLTLPLQLTGGQSFGHTINQVLIPVDL